MGNAARDLGRQFLEPSPGWPELYWIEVPSDDGDIKIPMFLPHLFVDSLVCQEEWKLDEDSLLLQWLKKLFAEQELQEDPATLVPLTIWGDAVPFTKKDSLFQVTACMG